MAGFAILPGRLRKQLARLFVNKEAPVGDLQIFAQWMKEFNLSVGGNFCFHNTSQFVIDCCRGTGDALS